MLHCSLSKALSYCDTSFNTILQIHKFALIRFIWFAVTEVVGVDFGIPWGQVTLERYGRPCLVVPIHGVGHSHHEFKSLRTQNSFKIHLS